MSVKVDMFKNNKILSKYSIPIILLLLVLASCILLPNFATGTNVEAILFQYSIIGFLALGQLLVLLTGGIDLSQSYMVAMTTIIISVLLEKVGLAGAIIAGVCSTTFLGLLNGLMIANTNMPAFVVTLSMQGIARGLAMVVANAKPVPISSEIFANFGKATIFGFIPISAIIWIALCLGAYYLLTRRKLGRYMFAVGSNEQGAVLSGVNVKKVKVTVYTASACLTAIGAIIWAARLTSGSPNAGAGYEMESIAACVVGGCSLFGGVGTVLGMATGVLIFGVINSILNLAGISPFLQGTLKGVVILLAVILAQPRKTDR